MNENLLSDSDLDQVSAGRLVDSQGRPIDTKVEWPVKSWDDVKKAWDGFVRGAKEVLGAA